MTLKVVDTFYPVPSAPVRACKDVRRITPYAVTTNRKPINEGCMIRDDLICFALKSLMISLPILPVATVTKILPAIVIPPVV